MVEPATVNRDVAGSSPAATAYQRLAEYDVFSVPVGDIYYDADFNCRGEFTLQSVKELANSIEQNGLQFPIVVQSFTEPPFRLLAGHRRFKACTIFLKWKEIPASVRPDLTEHQSRILNFTENLERKDLNILEEALALENTFKGQSLRQISKAIKRETRWVHSRQKLLRLPESIQQQAAAGLLTATNIEAIWSQPPAKRLDAAEKIVRLKQQKAKGIGHFKTFRCRKTKAEMRAMVARMLEAGVEGLAPRALVWACGFISDDEIWNDVQGIQKKRKSVITVCQMSKS